MVLRLESLPQMDRGWMGKTSLEASVLAEGGVKGRAEASGAEVLGHEGEGLGDHFTAIANAAALFGEVASPAAAARLARKELQHVAHDAMSFEFWANPLINVGNHGFGNGSAGWNRGIGLEEVPVGRGKDVGLVIGCTANHDGIDVAELSLGLVEGEKAAVDFDKQVGKRLLETVDVAVAQWRNGSVLFWV